MCARPVSRLLWCAPLSERGVVQQWGSKSWQWHVRPSVSSGAGVWSKCGSGSSGICICICICTCICIIRCICMCICICMHVYVVCSSRAYTTCICICKTSRYIHSYISTSVHTVSI